MIGLCGCGNMGAAIAVRLAGPAGGLRVFDLDAEKAAAVAEAVGASAVASLADLAGSPGPTEPTGSEGSGQHALTVVLSLPHAAASRAVVADLATVLAPGSVIVETSTVAPSDVRAAATACEPAGVLVVDAAILSGVAQMQAGTSALLIGGADEAVAAAQPVLDALAERQVRLGALGTGMAAKVANNAVSHAVMVVLLEAAALAEAEGISRAAFTEMLQAPDAGLMRPLTHRLAERVANGDYEGGMPTEAARKDSEIALAMAKESGVPLFAIEAAHTPYELAVAAGYGRLDYAVLARLWERWKPPS